MGLEFENEERKAEVPEGEESPEFFAVPIYTYILLACIGAVFLAQFLTSTDPQFFAVDRVSAYYAGFDKHQFLAGDWWRAFTGVLVHSGVLHVGMNAYALYSFGRLIELLSNRAHVAIIFVLSALGGDLLSLIFNPASTSVGASGGIVGFLSYLAVYAFKRRQFIASEFRRSLIVNIGFILVFGLVLFNVVDNYGHIGGLLVGAIYGLVQIPGDQYTDPRRAGVLVRTLGFGSLALVVLMSAATIMTLYVGGK